MPELIALQLRGDDVVDAVRRIWDDGDAVLPLPAGAPAAHVRAVLEANRPAALETEAGRERLDGSVPVLDGDALVISTSGTTGDPKGAIHTTGSVTAAAYATAVATGVESDVRWLACLPLWHVGGFSVLTRALVCGLGIEVHDRFDAAALDDAARRGATHVSLVPTALGRIDAAAWRTILLGGSAIPDPRPANTIATYGMTETMGGVVYDGLALPGVSMRVIDPVRSGAAGDVVAGPGVVGPIELRTPTLLRAYRSVDDPHGAAPDAVASDGWYRTGDLGSIGDDGRLRVHGRADDVVNTGGEKVWPTIVEEILDTDHRVAESAIIGAADAEWGQRVVAVVVPADPASPPPLEGLRDLVRAQLPAHCAPKELVLADSLPRTDLGKIRRALIAAQYPEIATNG